MNVKFVKEKLQHIDIPLPTLVTMTSFTWSVLWF